MGDKNDPHKETSQCFTYYKKVKVMGQVVEQEVVMVEPVMLELVVVEMQETPENGTALPTPKLWRMLPIKGGLPQLT